MKRIYLSVFGILTVFCLSTISTAQESSYSFYGDVRFAHIGIDTEPDGIGGPNTLMRLRPGIRFVFNENHSFSGRIAYLLSKEFEPLTFTLKADGNNQLTLGSMSFDEFYYQYENGDFLLKAGRFQKSINVLTNAKRSHFRFQSNGASVHWSDGLYLKKSISEDWFGEAVIEYQHINDISYPYRANLNFGNNEHNLNYYLGAENRTPNNNIIQKGFGLFVAPNAFLKPSGYSTYVAMMSRITLDFPARDALNGGSVRIAGELGQNINTAFENGTSAVTSFGINNFADHHEFMIEFASTDSQWLTSSAYGANSDEVEFRYRYVHGPKFNFDIRYRIRESRSDFISTQYSTFLRFTLSI